VLVRLEDDEYRARVAEQQGLLDNAIAKLNELEAGSRPQEIQTAQAAVDKAQAELDVAQINYKRLADLADSHSVSQQQIDDADSLMGSRRAVLDSEKQQLSLSKLGPRKEEIDAQRGTVRELQGSLALAQVDLDDTVIRSPITGTVLERNVETGEFVTNGFVGDRGAKGYVLSIADLNDLRVDLDVSQNDFAKVSPHQPCWIVTDAYPDRRYEGDVDLISPEANRQKATVDVRVKIFNPDELLKPDMNATVSFMNKAKLATTQAAATMPAADRPALRIPSTAVRDGSVFVVEDGKAVKRTIAAGSTDPSGNIEITKGLIGGEDLIVNPPDSLADGQSIKVASE
jgi:HlyD family secretion protein